MIAQTRPVWVPSVFEGWTFLTLDVWQWLGIGMVVVLGYVLASLAQVGALWVGNRLTRLTTTSWDDQLVTSARGPLKLLFFSAILYSGTRPLQLPGPVATGFEIAARSLLIVSVAWFLLRLLHNSSGIVSDTLSASGDPIRARGVRTHLTVLRSLIEVAIYVVAAALALMQFDIVRSVGVSLLASAGIAGLVIGLAAQKTIGNLLAGIQLSITQPVRIGDQVIIAGEWGTVEEITLTYVVVRVWDLRRLVIPVSQFLDTAFQNWTRNSPELLGVVLMHVDFSTEVDAFRAELKRVLEGEGSKLWNGKVQGVQITDATDRTVTMRALMSANSAGEAFDLRCLVRERFMKLLSDNPRWLPKTRTHAENPPAIVMNGEPPRQP